ncbi:MAG: biopolymer transporter ExbD [Fibrobacterota bacterium]
MAFRPSKRKDKALSRLIEAEDIDVTPLMNMMVILIPFLISMAVFTEVAAINFSLPPAMAEGEGPSNEPPAANESEKLDISIAITDQGFTLAGTGQVLPPILKTADGKYDHEALNRALRAIKMHYPNQEDIVLIIEQDIFYEDIVTVMDICRDAQFPNIGLSGGLQ